MQDADKMCMSLLATRTNRVRSPRLCLSACGQHGETHPFLVVSRRSRQFLSWHCYGGTHDFMQVLMILLLWCTRRAAP